MAFGETTGHQKQAIFYREFLHWFHLHTSSVIHNTKEMSFLLLAARTISFRWIHSPHCIHSLFVPCLSTAASFLLFFFWVITALLYSSRVNNAEQNCTCIVRIYFPHLCSMFLENLTYTIINLHKARY